jgi:anti-sigma B factor antagonist
MTITKKLDGTKLIAAVEGRLDTNTTPEAEKQLKGSLEHITELVLDFKNLSYISSAGLRLLLTLHKSLSAKGSLKIINVNEIVQEIFEVTGFSDILNIE